MAHTLSSLTPASFNMYPLRLIVLIFFILPSTSSVIFSAFPCVSFDQGDGHVISYQQVDFSLMCADQGENTPERMDMMIYASLMVAIFPFGMPLMLFALMYSKREAIEERETRRGGPELTWVGRMPALTMASNTLTIASR